MNVLALDTSSDALVLGLQRGETRTGVFEVLDRSHSREILPRITGLLKEAGLSLDELQLIVYGQGPGSFTGLRITVGVVQGLAFGLDIPVAPVSSLACLAQEAYRRDHHERIAVALLARQQEVFFGAYEIVDGIARLVDKEAVLDVENAPSLSGEGWVGIGSGWKFRE
ncbi:MAG: tRNA (adenosine(37)-N6)-threonylcarbamoyltransferase complex dimerization subunit type 1 TsaB, partial [Pseudomonadales bacterium]|nr:tRNA (adenosine(37)-N6)-threonylcarbamoyltransferase complex dimerization subunit type 1 TsaB [Pseudomonadales bacterium]